MQAVTDFATRNRYVQMDRKGGSATNNMSRGEAAEAAGHQIDESKFTK